MSIGSGICYQSVPAAGQCVVLNGHCMNGCISVGLAYHLLCTSNLHLEFIYFIFITKN